MTTKEKLDEAIGNIQRSILVELELSRNGKLNIINTTNIARQSIIEVVEVALEETLNNSVPQVTRDAIWCREHIEDSVNSILNSLKE